MRCILHIGTEKTGTTVLQAWLHRNDVALASHGIYYSKCFGRPTNRKLSVVACGEERPAEALSLYGIRTPKEHNQFRNSVVRSFQEEIKALPRGKNNTYIISNEHCHSRLITAENVEWVRDLLAPHFSSVRILCFLRPQVDLLLSRLSTASRFGVLVNRDRCTISGEDPYFNYLELYLRWSHWFHEVNFVPYRRNPDIISYLAGYLELVRSDFEEPKASNATLDYRTIALKNNIALQGVRNGKRFFNRQDFTEDFPTEVRLSIGRAEAKRIQAKFEKQNRKLVGLCDDIEAVDLEPDWAKYPVEGNIDKVGEVIFKPQLRRMVVRFNVELWLERARTKLTETQLAIARQDRVKAERLLKLAKDFIENAAQGELEEVAASISSVRKRLEFVSKGLARLTDKPSNPTRSDMR